MSGIYLTTEQGVAIHVHEDGVFEAFIDDAPLREKTLVDLKAVIKRVIAGKRRDQKVHWSVLTVDKADRWTPAVITGLSRVSSQFIGLPRFVYTIYVDTPTTRALLDDLLQHRLQLDQLQEQVKHYEIKHPGYGRLSEGAHQARLEQAEVQYIKGLGLG